MSIFGKMNLIILYLCVTFFACQAENTGILIASFSKFKKNDGKIFCFDFQIQTWITLISFFTAFDKLLVVGGVTKNGYTKEVEIIDLMNPENVCSNMKSLPESLEKTTTALFEGNPLICGNIF